MTFTEQRGDLKKIYYYYCGSHKTIDYKGDLKHDMQVGRKERTLNPTEERIVPRTSTMKWEQCSSIFNYFSVHKSKSPVFYQKQSEG